MSCPESISKLGRCHRERPILRLIVVASLLLTFSALLHADNASKPQVRPKAQSNVVDASNETLEACEVRNTKWQDWYTQNAPICEYWQREYRELVESNRELRIQIGLAFCAVGFGLFLAWSLVKTFRKLWPISKTRRLLITLLLVASWISLAVLVAINDPNLQDHPINLLSAVMVYSLPALAFGGVAAWWFGRTKPEVLW